VTNADVVDLIILSPTWRFPRCLMAAVSAGTLSTRICIMKTTTAPGILAYSLKENFVQKAGETLHPLAQYSSTEDNSDM